MGRARLLMSLTNSEIQNEMGIIREMVNLNNSGDRVLHLIAMKLGKTYNETCKSLKEDYAMLSVEMIKRN